MSALEKVIRAIHDPDYRFLIKDKYGLNNRLSDEEYLKKKYHAKIGKKLNLENPYTFNEKLQWLKLHDRNPDYIKMVDKFEVKKYLSKIIGARYIIPTYCIWDYFEDIDFDTLPDQFVLKTTHDSGGVVVCSDKKNFDIHSAEKKINKSLKRNYYFMGREWPYKHVKPRIIAEKYLSDSNGQLTDYKVHCFNGEPRIILVCKNRFTEEGMSEDFFTANWEHLSLRRLKHANSLQQIEKPKQLDDMLELSKIISKKIPFIRCDYYIVDDRIYVGELTFYPANGFEPFIPEIWDYTFGEYLKIQ